MNSAKEFNQSQSMGSKTLNRSFIPVRVGGNVKSMDCKTISLNEENQIEKESAKSEPPEIPFDKIIKLKKFKDEQKQFMDNRNESIRKIDMIKEQLTEIKVKIESMGKEQENLNDRIATCQDCGQLLKLARQKSEEHRNLMKFIKLEEKLTEELNRTQRSICETGVAEQTFSLQVEKEFNEINMSYERRKDFLARNRIIREKRNERNARAVHKRTVREVITSLKNANKLNTRKIQKEKLQSIKIARSKCEKYILKTVETRKEQNRQIKHDTQTRVFRQERLLGQLKTEIDKQKDILWVEHKMRQKKKQKEEEEREARRVEMLLAGENPYVYEKMQVAVEKAKFMKKKIEDEKQNIKKLVKGMEEMSQAKQKEEQRRKSWDDIWAKRLEEKKQKEKKKQRQMYGFDRESRREINANPIQFDPINTNFKICILNHSYQQVISVIHKFRECGRIKAVIPHPLKPYVTVVPKELTAFKNKPSHFCVKFCPLLKMLRDEKISKFFDQTTQIVDFPVNFHLDFPFTVPSPKVTTFLAVVTDTRLEITPTDIDLGRCDTAETVKFSLTIQNKAMIPQQVGFMEVPVCITVQPNYGFITLLPFETRKIDLLFSATETMDGKRTFRIKLHTLQNNEYVININLKAVVETCTVQLSSNRIMFPATCYGSVVSTCLKVISTIPQLKGSNLAAHTTLTNKFVFKTADEHSPIEIRPKAGFIEPGHAVNVFVSYKATVEEDDVKARVIQIMENDFIAHKGKMSFELDSINGALEMLAKELTAREERLAAKLSSLYSPRRNSSKGEKGTERKSIDEKVVERKSVDEQEHVGEHEDDIEESASHSHRPSMAPNKLKKHKNSGKKKLSTIRHKGDNKNDDSSQRHKDTKPLAEKSPSHVENESAAHGRRGSSKRESLKKPSLHDELSPEIFRLNHRRDELTELLNRDFEPPSKESISVYSAEFKKAEKEMMRQIVPTSKMYTVPCYVYDSDNNVNIVLLSIKCAMLPPSLVLLDDSSVLDFGSVCLGNKVVKDLTFANFGTKPITLKADIFNPYGPFVRCNALRTLNVNETFKLRIRYEPTDMCESEESVYVCGAESKIMLTLKGQCVLPKLRIFPIKKDIYIGVLEPQSVGTYQFVVENPSKGEIIVCVKLTLTGILEDEVEIDMGESAFNDEVVTPVPPNSAIKPVSPDNTNEHHEHQRTSLVDLGNLGSGSRESTGETRETLTKRRQSKKKRSISKTADDERRRSRGKNSMTPVPPVTPPPFVGPFRINEEGVEKEVHLMEMLSYLQEQEKVVFFQAVPPKLTIQPGESKKFVVYFIPMAVGRYFGNFEVSVMNHVVHEFSALGVSTKLRSDSLKSN